MIEDQRYIDRFVQSHRVLLTEDEERTLFEKWHRTKSNDVLTEIVKAYTPIIRKSIRELASYRADEEELVSEGLLALVEAAKRFDLDLGLRFSTYAKGWVKGIMLGYITKSFFMVNVCTSHEKKKLFFKIRRMIAEELTKRGKFKMSHELAEELSTKYNVDYKIVHSIYDMIRQPWVSLDEPSSFQDSNTTFIDHVNADTPSVETIMEQVDGAEFHTTIINSAMERVLDSREKRIFTAQVLTEKDEVVILEDLGKEFDITRERVRQIRDRARNKVRNELLRRLTSGDVVDTNFL